VLPAEAEAGARRLARKLDRRNLERSELGLERRGAAASAHPNPGVGGAADEVDEEARRGGSLAAHGPQEHEAQVGRTLVGERAEGQGVLARTPRRPAGLESGGDTGKRRRIEHVETRRVGDRVPGRCGGGQRYGCPR
jgi:hypothetical protein